MQTATILPFRRPRPAQPDDASADVAAMLDAARRNMEAATQLYVLAGLCLWCAAIRACAAMGERR